MGKPSEYLKKELGALHEVSEALVKGPKHQTIDALHKGHK